MPCSNYSRTDHLLPALSGSARSSVLPPQAGKPLNCSHNCHSGGDLERHQEVFADPATHLVDAIEKLGQVDMQPLGQDLVDTHVVQLRQQGERGNLRAG